MTIKRIVAAVFVSAVTVVGVAPAAGAATDAKPVKQSRVIDWDVKKPVVQRAIDWD